MFYYNLLKSSIIVTLQILTPSSVKIKPILIFRIKYYEIFQRVFWISFHAIKKQYQTHKELLHYFQNCITKCRRLYRQSHNSFAIVKEWDKYAWLERGAFDFHRPPLKFGVYLMKLIQSMLKGRNHIFPHFMDDEPPPRRCRTSPHQAAIVCRLNSGCLYRSCHLVVTNPVF